MNKRRKALLKEITECYLGYSLYESDKYSSDIEDSYSTNYIIFKDYRSSFEESLNVFRVSIGRSDYPMLPMELE